MTIEQIYRSFDDTDRQLFRDFYAVGGDNAWDVLRYDDLPKLNSVEFSKRLQKNIRVVSMDIVNIPACTWNPLSWLFKSWRRPTWKITYKFEIVDNAPHWHLSNNN